MIACSDSLEREIANAANPVKLGKVGRLPHFLLLVSAVHHGGHLVTGITVVTRIVMSLVS